MEKEQKFDEWEQEGIKLFGEDKKKWKFICPRCGHVASIQDFLDIGCDANDAFQNCIGRMKKGIGCDWAAYGLFGTLGKGKIVISQEGKKVNVFDFAKEEN